MIYFKLFHYQMPCEIWFRTCKHFVNIQKFKIIEKICLWTNLIEMRYVITKVWTQTIDEPHRHFNKFGLYTFQTKNSSKLIDLYYPTFHFKMTMMPKFQFQAKYVFKKSFVWNSDCVWPSINASMRFCWEIDSLVCFKMARI